jgi:hypothetical protein
VKSAREYGIVAQMRFPWRRRYPASGKLIR